MSEVYKTVEYKGFEIEIIQDDCPMNPREWDNIGTMICKHSRYNLGDVKDSEDYVRYGNSVEEDMAMYFYVNHIDKRHDEHEDGMLTAKGISAVNRWMEKNVLWLPLYLYDHSGITMSTGSFASRWDSGQVGFIYITKKKVREMYGWKIVTKERKEKLYSYLESDVKTYDQYLTGEVYGYNVEEIGNSCYGYYGDVGIEDAITEAKNDIDYEILRKHKLHFEQLIKWIKNKVPLSYRKPLEFAL